MQTPIPWRYRLGRIIIDSSMQTFYRSIVVENADFIPSKDDACLLCSNHDNCLMDAFLLDWAPPRKSRKLLRAVAKSTVFHLRDYSALFVQQTGCIPIYRQMDFEGQSVDNTDAFREVAEALTRRDTVLMFPEGNTQYRPYLRPFKTGAARAISETLSKNRDDPNFQITLLTCSINYTKRYSFRSSVLITYHAPIIFRVQDHPELIAPVDFDHIRRLTDTIGTNISLGTVAASSWDILRAANFATRLYAPFGLHLSLGNRIRIRKRFADNFDALFREHDTDIIATKCPGLEEYARELSRLALHDEYARQSSPPRAMLLRGFACLTYSLCLFVIALPSLPLWLPVLLSPIPVVRGLLQMNNPIESHVRIGQACFVYGSVTRLLLHATCVLCAILFGPRSGASAAIFAVSVALLVPALMWIGLRATEKGLAAFSEAKSLAWMLWYGQKRMRTLRNMRAWAQRGVYKYAVDELGLPKDPYAAFVTRNNRNVAVEALSQGAANSRPPLLSQR